MFEDENVKYVVSFRSESRVPMFVEFLSGLCNKIGEESLYLTMGYKSYLVWPKGGRHAMQAG